MKNKKAKAGDIIFWAQFFCFLLFILLQTQCLSAFAVSRIHQAYFAENGSLIIHTKEKSPLEISEIKQFGPRNYSIYFSDSKLTHKLKKKFANNDLKIHFKELKNKIVELDLDYTQINPEQIQSRPILDGLAYEIFPQLNTATNNPRENPSDLFALSQEANGDELLQSFTGTWQKQVVNKEDSEIIAQHQLQVSKSDKNFQNIINSKKTLSENFLNELDSDLVSSLMSNPAFIESTHAKIDSAALTNIANLLSEQGQIDEAYKAYQEALSLDNKNNQAYLGMAKVSTDDQEKLISYLATIDSKTLIEIGAHWFKTGKNNYDNKQLMQAFIPFQFAIIKEPRNPELRFAYANILEDSGFNFYPEASKRYLEAAALAKQLYQSGDLEVENLMRKSAENLIRLVCQLGKQDEAIKYCNSYLNLGFDRFLDGRPVLALLKEIRFKRNPFLRS